MRAGGGVADREEKRREILTEQARFRQEGWYA